MRRLKSNFRKLKSIISYLSIAIVIVLAVAVVYDLFAMVNSYRFFFYKFLFTFFY